MWPRESPCPDPGAQPPLAWFARAGGLQSHPESCAAAQGTAGRDGLWEVSPEHAGPASLVPAGWHCRALESNTQKLYFRSPKFLKESKKIRFLSWLQRLSHWLPFPRLAWKPKGTRVPLAKDRLKRVEGFSLNYHHVFFNSKKNIRSFLPPHEPCSTALTFKSNISPGECTWVKTTELLRWTSVLLFLDEQLPQCPKSLALIAVVKQENSSHLVIPTPSPSPHLPIPVPSPAWEGLRQSIPLAITARR